MTFDIYVPPTKSIALYVFMGVEGTMLFLWFDRREDICGHDDEEGTYECVSYELIEIKVAIHFLKLCRKHAFIDVFHKKSYKII